MAWHVLVSPPKDLIHKASVIIPHTLQLGWKRPLGSSSPAFDQAPSWQLDMALSSTSSYFLNTFLFLPFVFLIPWGWESCIWTVSCLMLGNVLGLPKRHHEKEHWLCPARTAWLAGLPWHCSPWAFPKGSGQSGKGEFSFFLLAHGSHGGLAIQNTEQSPSDLWRRAGCYSEIRSWKWFPPVIFNR